MSVLIKGAKPPSGCRWCYFCEDSKCALIVGCEFDDTNGTQRRKDCPLIELPDHGDLIDRDALMFDTEERYCTGCDSYRGLRCRACWVDDMHGEIEDAPVIIPTERSE